jgi:hypothetical protein
VRLQGEPDRRGLIFVVGILLLVAIVVAAYFLFIEPAL